MNNYEKQALSAQKRFLQYDPGQLARKWGLQTGEGYLYAALLGQPYRILLAEGSLEKQTDDGWVDANSFEEVMTLLDLICDSREDRYLTGRWKSMEAFGLGFHRGLLEAHDPAADSFAGKPQKLEQACKVLRGRKIPGADIGYALELFGGVEIGLQFWDGDEEFAPRLRFLWDENADRYLHYETMFYAVTLLLRRLEALMQTM